MSGEDILARIVAYKIWEVKEKKEKFPLTYLKAKLNSADPPRDFIGSVFGKREVSIIAEIKRLSPSAGILRENLDPSQIARIYQENGASAVSVLLDRRFFGGKPEDIEKVREATFLPILAKEFIIDEYQIYEARIKGADAVLLIARILEEDRLTQFCEIAQSLGLSCIVEIHSPEEVKKVYPLPPWIMVGINNRNLKNFQVDLSTAQIIYNSLPPGRLVVSESGIKNLSDIKRLKDVGISVFLVGEAILGSPDPARKLRELCYG